MASSLVFPEVPTHSLAPPPYMASMPAVPSGFGTSFMNEADSVIDRFKRAGKPNGAFLFFKGFCIEAHTQAGMGEAFDSKLYWFADERKKWQAYMVALPNSIWKTITEDPDPDPDNTYHWVREGMKLFEKYVINSVKTKFRDQSFPNTFFTDLLRRYQVGNGKILMVGVGRKRRKTRKARKTKRHTKLRIKRRLIAS